MYSSKDVGTRLAFLRKKTGLSVKQAVTALEKAGYTISRESLEKWEKGERVPNAEAICYLCDFYGESANFLLGIEPHAAVTDSSGSLSENAKQKLAALSQGSSWKTLDALLRTGFFDKILPVITEIQQENKELAAQILLEESSDGIYKLLRTARHNCRDIMDFVEEQVEAVTDYKSVESAAKAALKHLEGKKNGKHKEDRE